MCGRLTSAQIVGRFAAVTTIEWQPRLLDQLTERLGSEPGVRELWVLGSVAEAAVPDGWTDLDVGIVAESSAVDRLAEVRDWLPDADRIALVRGRALRGRDFIRRVVFTDLQWLDIFVMSSADTLRRPRRRLLPEPLPAETGLSDEDELFCDAMPEATAEEVVFDAAMALKKLSRGNLLDGMEMALELAHRCVKLGQLIRSRESGSVHHRGGSPHDHIAADIGAVAPGSTAIAIAHYVRDQANRYCELHAELDPSHADDDAPDLSLLDRMLEALASDPASAVRPVGVNLVP